MSFSLSLAVQLASVAPGFIAKSAHRSDNAQGDGSLKEIEKKLSLTFL